jgi:hypothetical protein
LVLGSVATQFVVICLTSGVIVIQLLIPLVL